jgi:hypothetical protein
MCIHVCNLCTHVKKLCVVYLKTGGQKLTCVCVMSGRYSRNPPDDVHIGRVTADIGRVTAKVALTTIKQRIKHGFRGFSGCWTRIRRNIWSFSVQNLLKVPKSGSRFWPFFDHLKRSFILELFRGILLLRQLLTIFLLFSVDTSSLKNISKKSKT